VKTHNMSSTLKLYYQENTLEAGCDEAGRGCLAGPVVAAAVILPKGYYNPGINDSKRLKEDQRESLRIEIERDALDWAVGIIDHQQIDELNILKASVLAMHLAVGKLKTRPGHLIIDGNYFIPYQDVPHRCIVKGDQVYQSIAAASILAKTHRDRLMSELHHKYPIYGWNKNKGYPTVYHREAICKHGPCFFHRKSFQLTDPQLKIIFDETA
jgi:ribonuclease HII